MHSSCTQIIVQVAGIEIRSLIINHKLDRFRMIDIALSNSEQNKHH